MGYPFYTRDTGDIKSEISPPAGVFDHPSGYLPDPGLVDAVNVALLLNTPLLLTGEPGTGKTQFLLSLIYQLSLGGECNRGEQPKFLIFDFNEDYTDPDFLKRIGGQELRPWDLPLNFFDTSSCKSHLPQVERAKFFTDTISKIFNLYFSA